ncbi:hypothetical protein ElyMa_004046800 [Elysia marginata]|uniref:Uncharacterized protein n=1 Tax=Elysia marginata TaxID=1093978 RepID=A0AAV4G633_9GAST|nr:hypothetical protein ElyMa_004046800 [Elysia marginata]
MMMVLIMMMKKKKKKSVPAESLLAFTTSPKFVHGSTPSCWDYALNANIIIIIISTITNSNSSSKRSRCPPSVLGVATSGLSDFSFAQHSMVSSVCILSRLSIAASLSNLINLEPENRSNNDNNKRKDNTMNK